MAIFAPTFNDKNFDDVFVYNFYTYNNQLQSLVPLGMTFGNLLGETIGYPHPVILRMSKVDAENLLDDYYFSVATQLWNNIKKENPLVDEETGKNVWEYSLPIEGFLSIPSDLTQAYDLTGEGLGSIKDFIIGQVFGPKIGIVLAPDGGLGIGGVENAAYRPGAMRAVEASFDSDNLLKTYCRHKNSNILNIGGNLEDVGTFFDCGTLLPFEEFYLSAAWLPVGAAGPLNHVTFSRQRLIINNKEVHSKEPMPNCNKCLIWVATCFDSCRGDGIIVRRLNDADNLEDESKRFFRSFEEANAWVKRQRKTWVCCATYVSDEPFIDNIEHKCLEISKFCADAEGFEITYNSEEECEEDCGKKWYCINNECVRRFQDDPEVALKFPYSRKIQCLLLSSDCRQDDSDSDSDDDSIDDSDSEDSYSVPNMLTFIP